MNISKTSLLALAAVTLLAGCARPSHDQAVLSAIKAEAGRLTAMRPTKAHLAIPKNQWPRVIASLKPEAVIVYPDGVEIMIKPYFDGGWGYFVPNDMRETPEPAARFSKLSSNGVYWHHPY